MTPKEKAKELIEKFSEYCLVTSETVSLSRSKQCALIVVDEILSHIVTVNPYAHQYADYWINVKQEIERL